MNKRGQVTVFVIIGIVIVVIVFLVFFLLGDKIKKETEIELVFDESSLEPLGDFVGDCIGRYTEGEGEEEGALSIIGKQGGLIYVNSENSVAYDNPDDDEENIENVAYHFREGVNYAITRHIEGELHDYVLNNLKTNDCVDLDKIRGDGFVITNGNKEDMALTVSIGDDNLIMDLDYPIIITKGDVSISESRFTETFEVPLGNLMKVAEDIVEYQIIKVGGFSPNRNDYLELHHGLYISPRHFSMDEDSEVYRIYNKFDDDYFFQIAMQI